MLFVREIYAAIMGESRHSGWPCVLVRLTGCHRRCGYCDTEYAFQGGDKMSVADVLARVHALGHRMLLLTGGEPLLQPAAADLMREALAAGFAVVVETSGTTGVRVPLAAVPAGVCRVVDVKTPGSGIAAGEIDWDGLAALDASDEIKLVITDRRDYDWARELVAAGLDVGGRRRRLPQGVPVTFSPAWGSLSLRDLAGWILADRLPVRFQVQLHKVVWPEAEGGV
ncbi:MAG TPA: radical SAM protein [Candidatus Krumholzibacteria bacterium]|nr:radical SAM protein [Candidatus Krumholzibacteria bacterium]HPD71073.1 radical SAM protein [Candidatus Krumholzibacteria bacterium]HRY39227.1 radical SAM protein [Candidatus Krumholzibacteria bacterium]